MLEHNGIEVHSTTNQIGAWQPCGRGGTPTLMKSWPSSLFSFSITGNTFAQQDREYLARRTLKRNAQVLVVWTARVDILLAKALGKKKSCEVLQVSSNS